MSNYTAEDLEQAIEDTRERRKAASEAGRKKPREARTSTPTETPKSKASKTAKTEDEGG